MTRERDLYGEEDDGADCLRNDDKPKKPGRAARAKEAPRVDESRTTERRGCSTARLLRTRSTGERLGWNWRARRGADITSRDRKAHSKLCTRAQTSRSYLEKETDCSPQGPENDVNVTGQAGSDLPRIL